MRTYLSTFITGFKEVINQTLKTALLDVEVQILADGLIIYKTQTSLDDIKKLKFFNNTFFLIKQLKDLDPNLPNPFVKQVIRDSEFERIISTAIPQKRATFRVIISKENEFVKIHNDILKKIEEKITQATDWPVNRANPDYEFWFILRREGLGLFGLRLTKRPNYEKILEKGELYPELAYILCLISEPNKDDVFLDPFAGHGSIPTQRLNFPRKKIIACEIDRELQLKLQNKFKKQVKIELINALSLNTIPARFITKIVTDPPWGLHSITDLNLPEFYSEMLRSFERVLTKGGILVILTAQKELFEKTIKKFSGALVLVNQYNTLVSGQKAAVYKLRKIS